MRDSQINFRCPFGTASGYKAPGTRRLQLTKSKIKPVERGDVQCLKAEEEERGRIKGEQGSAKRDVGLDQL